MMIKIKNNISDFARVVDVRLLCSGLLDTYIYRVHTNVAYSCLVRDFMDLDMEDFSTVHTTCHMPTRGYITCFSSTNFMNGIARCIYKI